MIDINQNTHTIKIMYIKKKMICKEFDKFMDGKLIIGTKLIGIIQTLNS